MPGNSSFEKKSSATDVRHHTADVRQGRSLAAPVQHTISFPSTPVAQLAKNKDTSKKSSPVKKKVRGIQKPAPKKKKQSVAKMKDKEYYQHFLDTLHSGQLLRALPGEYEDEKHEFVPQEEDRYKDLDEESIDIEKRSEGIDMSTPSLRIITSNIEKYGQRTNRQEKEDKLEVIGEGMKAVSPTLTHFQEVTSPKLFLDGSKRIPGLKKQKIGDGTKETFGDRYEMMEGPGFQSGNYKESYPMAYDPSEIHHVPTMKVHDSGTNEMEDHDFQDERPFLFGKEADGLLGEKERAQTARPITSWNFQIPSGRYNMRPPSKTFQDKNKTKKYAKEHGNLSHRKIDYTDISMIPVHTSPSISTINKQIGEIMDVGDQLKQQGENVIMSGDFYMEKKAKRKWNELKEGRNKNWGLANAGVQTNYPNKKKKTEEKDGQEADVHLFDKDRFDMKSTFAIPPNLKDMKDPEEHIEQLRSGKVSSKKQLDNLKQYPNYGIDHAMIFSDFDVKPKQKPKPTSKITKPIKKMNSQKK